MAHKHRMSFIEAFRFVVRYLLLFSLATIGVAVAQHPVPLINQPLVPDAVKPGGAAFTLTVNGTGFVSGSVVKWNGSGRTTTFVNSSRLTAAILASDVATAGTASVTVVNPSPGGDTSSVAFFEVTTPSSAIVLSVPSAFATGATPQSVAVSDFNDDGKLDLAVANSNGNNVSVLLGNGDGTFQPAVNYGAGSNPFSVAVGDFNGDGKLDLAVANESSNNVSVLLGNGDGTFQAAVHYATGSAPESVAVGDFNRDGKLDLVVTNVIDNNLSVLLGNGDGTFQTQVAYAVGGSPLGVAVGDFNRDGKLDLAVANLGSNNVSVLLGNGDGTFQPAVNHGAGSCPSSVAVGDFNGDGKLDLAVANECSNNVSVLLGNGDGTFQAHVDYVAGAGPDSVALGDFNGDGKLDLAVANPGTSNISVLLGNGDGTFQAHVDYAAGAGPDSVAVGDFNGDGRLDFAIANDSGSVSILVQTPTTVSLSKTSLTFANQLIGTSSVAKTVKLTNTGGLTLTISSVAIRGTNTGDFEQTNNCGSGLSPGFSCTITVTFAPTQAGPRTASLTITDNAAGSPQQLALSGTGVTSGPNAFLSPSSLTFATQFVGTTSPAQSVTLSDYGTATLSITSIGFAGADPGDFHQTNTCGSSVAQGASCTISIAFNPPQSGSRTATLSVTDNAPGSPPTVSLTGTGTAAVCQTLGAACTSNTQCCNHWCGPYARRCCLPLHNMACTSSAQCCSGMCFVNPGQTVGRCQ
jgi:FG-GAP-like repeat/Abnormal spindle-like microcephaly-assoc'd, ASPM-SPD-2-Hydin